MGAVVDIAILAEAATFSFYFFFGVIMSATTAFFPFFADFIVFCPLYSFNNI